MCGIVGAAGDLNGGHEKALKCLLILDSLRGEDSTGAAFVQKFTGAVSVAKQLGDPFNLFNDNKFAKGMGQANRAIIGHNRYATVGGVSRQTAHPFDFDTLVGVHNGTLSSKWKLEDQADYKVDSQALYHNIEVLGLKDAISRLGSDNNAWSLVWWDKVEESLNFLRNKERPMFMCRTDDEKVLFWASEDWMLMAALARCNIKHGPIFSTEVDVHYSVVINKQGVMEKPKLARCAAPVPVYPPVVYHNQKPGHVGPKNNVHALPAPATAATPATSKGVVDQKKSQKSACDPSYTKVKGRLFEVLNWNIDSNGAKYLSLFDPQSPYIDVRLYPRKEDNYLFNQVGSDIIGDVETWSEADKKAVRGYYKVSPWGIKMVPPQQMPEPEYIHPADVDTTDEPDELFPNHRGHFVTESEWKKTYTMCEWCSEAVSPLNRNRFTTSGQCVCPACSKLPEVTEVVNLI